MKKMTAYQSGVMLLLAILLLLLATPASAVPTTGFLEGTAANGWQGAYAVQLSDGTVVNGAQQMIGGFTTLPTLPLTSSGCELGSGNCTLVSDVKTSTSFTMSFQGLALNGSATLGSLGTVSWSPQIVRLLPGDPSPTAAVLASTSGLGLKPSTFSFGFNSTLTTFYSAVNGGQVLSGLRLDFTDGIEPPTSGRYLEQLSTSTRLLINNGIPVSLGTPLSAQSVPVPSTGPLMALSLVGLLAWHWRHMKTVLVLVLAGIVPMVFGGCYPANIVATKWDSSSNGQGQTRCEEVDMRSNSEMQKVFSKYDGWRLIYISEYTTPHRMGTDAAVCFERANEKVLNLK
jgi:hypothetical protein